MASKLQAQFATVLGVVLLLVGLVGFAMNPVLGVFGVSTVHNLIHVVSGIVGIAAGLAMMGMHAKKFNIVFGFVYLLVAAVGFFGVVAVTELLGFSMGNPLADNLLHLVIAIAALGVGFGAKD